MGIGPTYQPWEGCALPLSYARSVRWMIFRAPVRVNGFCFAAMALGNVATSG